MDLVGDDRTQDREDHQWRGQGGERPEDQLRQDLQRGCPLAPEQSEGNRHDHSGDHPDIQGQSARPALGFVVGQGSVGRFWV